MDQYRRSRQLYIVEAALEYLVHVLVAGSFLATLTKQLGMSDSLTGILSSVIFLMSIEFILSLPYDSASQSIIAARERELLSPRDFATSISNPSRSNVFTGSGSVSGSVVVVAAVVVVVSGTDEESTPLLPLSFSLQEQRKIAIPSDTTAAAIFIFILYFTSICIRLLF